MVDLKQQNILMFTRTMRTGGTENVVLQLCKIFSPEVNKVIVCSCGGVHVATLEKMGIKHYEIPDMENKSPKTILAILNRGTQSAHTDKWHTYCHLYPSCSGWS